MGKTYYYVKSEPVKFIARITGKQVLRLTLCQPKQNIVFDFHEIVLKSGDVIQIDTSKHPALFHVRPPEPNPLKKRTKLYDHQ